MHLEIRLAQPQDYTAIAALHNADNEPHFHKSAEALERSDSKNTDGGRLVALVADRIVGTAVYWYWSDVNAFRIGIHCPDETINMALLRELEGRVGTRAQRLLSTVRSDFLANAHYLALGFREVFRSFGAELELRNFDASKFEVLEPKLMEQNVRIVPRSDWTASDAEAQLQALQLEFNQDIPSYEPVVTNTMDYRDRRLLEAFWVALHGDRCIGFTSLDAQPERITAYFDASGVARGWRQKGVGLALAARAVAWAKAQGFSEFNDGGAKANVGHWRTLERLGFELEPDWVTFEKVL